VSEVATATANATDTELLGRGALAKRLGVAVRTVDDWYRRGRRTSAGTLVPFPPGTRGTGGLQWSVADVDGWKARLAEVERREWEQRHGVNN
jgi:hypothetical protein